MTATTRQRHGIEPDGLARANLSALPLPTIGREQREKVRALLADQPDAELLADMLGLDQPEPSTVAGVGHSARHYHGATVPHTTKVGRWV